MTFHALHLQLVHAVAHCVTTGEDPDQALMDEAAKARADHVASMPEERPTFAEARASVRADMKSLGLLH